MCYVVVVPTRVCPRNHVEKCDFAWRQCAQQSRKMEIDAICDDPEQGMPPVIDVNDMPTHFYFLTLECQICTAIAQDSNVQTLVTRKEELERRLTELNAKIDALGEQYRIDTLSVPSVKEGQRRGLDRAVRERKMVLDRLEDQAAGVRVAENAIYAPRLDAILQELHELTADEDGGIQHIYLGPVSRTESDHDPPRCLPSSYSLEHLNRALYEIGSGGWLHPDGSVRLPIPPKSRTLS